MHLQLDNNLFSGIIPEELGNLDDLIILDLHSNALIGSIPEELGNLSQLRLLDISNNTLTGSVVFGSNICRIEGLDFIVDCNQVYCECCSNC